MQRANKNTTITRPRPVQKHIGVRAAPGEYLQNEADEKDDDNSER